MIEACLSIAKTHPITKLLTSLFLLSLFCLLSCRPPLEQGSSSVDKKETNPTAQVNSKKQGEEKSLPHSGVDNSNGNEVVVLFDNANIPLRVVQQSLLKMLASNYPSHQFIYLDARGQAQLQQTYLEQSLKNKPASIILFPIDCPAVSKILEQQNDLPPILSINGEGALAANSKSISISGEEIGNLAANFILERLQAAKTKDIDGQIAILHGSSSQLPQEAAILKTLRAKLESAPQLQLQHIAPANWNEVDAASRMLEALRIHPDINIVICLNDAIAHGAYLAARQLGRQGNILFLGIDAVGGPSGGISLVKDQMLAASIRQPFLMKEINEQLHLALSGAAWSTGKLAATESPEVVSIANAYEMARKYDRAAEPEALGLK